MIAYTDFNAGYFSSSGNLDLDDFDVQVESGACVFTFNKEYPKELAPWLGTTYTVKGLRSEALNNFKTNHLPGIRYYTQKTERHLRQIRINALVDEADYEPTETEQYLRRRVKTLLDAARAVELKAELLAIEEKIKNSDGEKDLLEALHYKKIEVVEEMFLKKDSVRTAALQGLSAVYKTSPDVLEKILKDNL
jgi:DNA-binding transcriptional MerR regulator